MFQLADVPGLWMYFVVVGLRGPDKWSSGLEIQSHLAMSTLLQLKYCTTLLCTYIYALIQFKTCDTLL